MTQGHEFEPSATTRTRRSQELVLAVALTAVVVALYLYFLTHVGGLFRDEVNSLNLAQGHLAVMAHDSFPILFPGLLRIWSEVGLAGTDLGLRIFGVLIGIGLTASFWLSARWLRRELPLWSLVLVALNAWVIYYAAWLRAYGLGSAMIALCAGVAWLYLEKPGLKTWLPFALMTILSVQALYQNTALVAAICAGGCSVCLRRRDLRSAGGVFLAGFVAAVSLLPYWTIVAGMPKAASPLRLDFDRLIAFNNFNTMVAYPLPQFFWVWCGLVAWLVVLGMAGLFRKSKDIQTPTSNIQRPIGGVPELGARKACPSRLNANLTLYSAVTLVCSAVTYVAFLRLANFPVQPWYFLPVVALAGVMFDASLPRLEGRLRALLWGGALATALMSALFAIRVLDFRFTNVDQLARKANSLVGRHDLVIVAPWQFGITFGHYFTNACPCTSVPPIEDHAGERYDLLLAQMQNTNAMRPLLTSVGDTLRSGNAVWIAGGIANVDGNYLPEAPPPPPLPYTGWNETPYRFSWNGQLGWFIHRHSLAIECIDAGTNENVNPIEQLPLYKVTGWKDQ